MTDKTIEARIRAAPGAGVRVKARPNPAAAATAPPHRYACTPPFVPTRQKRNDSHDG